MMLLSPASPLLSLDSFDHMYNVEGQDDGLIFKESDWAYDPCKEFLNEAAFREESEEAPIAQQIKAWQYPPPFQNVRASELRASVADFSPYSSASGASFSDVCSPNGCLSPVWHGSPSPVSPSVSAITDDVARWDFAEDSLLWAPAHNPRNVVVHRTGPFWCDPDAGPLPDIVITPSTSLEDANDIAAEDPRGQAQIQGESRLLSPANLFVIDCLPDVNDTIPPPSALYELSNSAVPPASLPTLIDNAAVETAAIEDSVGNQHTGSTSELCYRALSLPATSPSINRQEARRIEPARASSSKRHSPYTRPVKVLGSPSTPWRTLSPYESSFSSLRASSRDAELTAPADVENMSSDMVKDTVASNAGTEASIKRRKRPGNYQCGLCLATFTAKHNLGNHMNSHFGKKDHQCEVCERSFGNKSDLNRHKKKLHERPTH